MNTANRIGQYAVIFVSQRTEGDQGYAQMATLMEELASTQPGFCGIESVRDNTGKGITVSYWRDLAAIKARRNHAEHKVAREQGRALWYKNFQIQIAKIEVAYEF